MAERSTTDTGAYFAVFWLGFFAFALPASLRALAAGVSRRERLLLVSLIGVWSYVPKILRDPSTPLFHDELAHWSQTTALINHGTLFRPNSIVPIISYFPGLHSLTAAISVFTGVSPWRTGQILIAILHITALLGVCVLAYTLTGSSRVGAVAAVIYGINPGFMFFDAQYSYESLAIVVFIWALAATALALSHAADRRMCRGWAAIALVLIAACVTIHHLTSYTLAIVLVAVAVGVTVFDRSSPAYRSRRFTAWLLACCTAAGALAWLVVVTRGATIHYIAPYVGGGISQVVNLIKREQSGRVLFAGSSAPVYEKFAAFAAPILACVTCLVGMWLYRRRWRALAGAMLSLCAFGFLYFAAVPFILSSRGSEGARRSWTFSYLGLALVAGLTMMAAAPRLAATGRIRRQATIAGLVVAMMIVWVGNVTTAINVAYRFPGRYIYGSDTRSLTPELLATTKWFEATYGTGRVIATDRYTGLALASFGGESLSLSSTSFPLWQLFFDDTLPSRGLLEELRQHGCEFIVVDRRIAEYVPLIGVTFDEPEALQRTKPVSRQALEKFDRVPWAIKVHSSTNLSVYRIDYGAIGATTAARVGQ